MTPSIDAADERVLAYRPGDRNDDGISIAEILSTLWRRKLLLLSTIIGITVAGFTIVKLLTPTFDSTVVIVLSARQDSVLDLEAPYMNMPPADAVIRSEADTLQSRTLVDRVIDREHLMDDPEFNYYARPFEPFFLTRWGIVDHLPRFLQPYLRSKPLDPSMLTPEQQKYNVGTQVLKAYSVTPDAKTYTVKLDFSSVDAEKAARIVNAFADEYLKMQVDERAAAAAQAQQAINTQLHALAGHVEETGRAVEAYRRAHGIVNYPSTQDESNTLALQQVQNLAQDLATVRSQRAQLEAAQHEMQSLLANPGHVLSAPAVASAPVVENVRIQEVTAEAHLATLKGTYGDRYPDVIAARNALAQLRQRLSVEVNHAVDQLGAELRQARASEAELGARLDQLTSARQAEDRAAPELQRLEGEQVAAKAIYDAFAQGMMRSVVEDGVPMAKGRIVQHADIDDWPTFPNMMIFMAIIGVASVMIGVAVVFVLEARDKSFRTSDDIEETVQVPLLGMTLLAANRLPQLVGRATPVSQRLLAEPNSALSETVRLAQSAIVYARAEDQPKVVMVTSALPGEGKTTFTLAMGRLSAASGKRVLMIEAEMRKPTFARHIGAVPSKGLASYLEIRATLDEVIGIDKASGAHFIAACERSKFASELLSTPRMEQLLREAGATYDLVLVDTPPATIAADAIEVGQYADSAVLVVKWGTTPRHLVVEAARRLKAANVPLIGSVMTQVDARRYALYGRGELPYGYAREYYGA